MNLTDLMSGMGLALYPQIALVIFLAVFAAIVVRTWRQPRGEVNYLAHLPIADDASETSVKRGPAQNTGPARGTNHA